MIIDSLIISSQATLLDGIKQMDDIKRKLLIVNHLRVFFSLLSIGDIQRSILEGNDLSTVSVYDAVKDKQITVCREGDSEEHIRQQMLSIRCEFMPLLSADNSLTRVVFWEEFFAPDQRDKSLTLSLAGLSVVIMAGGKGERLKPITNIIPKPLIPLGNKPIVQEIAERFRLYGVTDFIMSVNYMAEVIKLYFKSIKEKDYNISYIQEERPLGTAGSLYLLKDRIKDTFFVTNCDILIDHSYSEIFEYHRKNNNDITAVGAMKIYSIPYGTFNVNDSGKFISIQEKPEHSYLINTGMYILEPSVLDLIPENQYMDITTLIEHIDRSGGKVGIYPINSSSWIDIGNWKEFNRANNLFNG